MRRLGAAGARRGRAGLGASPAGEIRTGDGRGPYRVRDAQALIAAAQGERLPIDENHATDLAAPNGLPASVRGWIVEMQARSDSIWGRVELTEEGRGLVAQRAYRGISPVIAHRKNGELTAILRASHVNRPNLRGLTTLHQDNAMEKLLEQLVKFSVSTRISAPLLGQSAMLHARLCCRAATHYDGFYGVVSAAFSVGFERLTWMAKECVQVQDALIRCLPV